MAEVLITSAEQRAARTVAKRYLDRGETVPERIQRIVDAPRKSDVGEEKLAQVQAAADRVEKGTDKDLAAIVAGIFESGAMKPHLRPSSLWGHDEYDFGLPGAAGVDPHARVFLSRPEYLRALADATELAQRVARPTRPGE